MDPIGSGRVTKTMKLFENWQTYELNIQWGKNIKNYLLLKTPIYQ